MQLKNCYFEQLRRKEGFMWVNPIVFWIDVPLRLLERFDSQFSQWYLRSSSKRVGHSTKNALVASWKREHFITRECLAVDSGSPWNARVDTCRGKTEIILLEHLVFTLIFGPLMCLLSTWHMTMRRAVKPRWVSTDSLGMHARHWVGTRTRQVWLGRRSERRYLVGVFEHLWLDDRTTKAPIIVKRCLCLDSLHKVGACTMSE
jgi:hypothetical protein